MANFVMTAFLFAHYWRRCFILPARECYRRDNVNRIHIFTPKPEKNTLFFPAVVVDQALPPLFFFGEYSAYFDSTGIFTHPGTTSNLIADFRSAGQPDFAWKI